MSDRTATPTTKRKPKRVWRWVKRMILACLLLLLAASLGFIGEVKWTRREGQKKLATATAKLDAEDPGWRFEDIVADHNLKVPPEGSNSAMKAVEIVKGFPKSDEPFNSLFDLRSQYDANRFPNELGDAEKWATLEERYPAYDPGIIQLRAWSGTTPRGRLIIDYTGGNPLDLRFDNTQHLRTANTVLAWDALRSAQAGHADRALASGRAGLHLARSVDFEPILILYLNRVGSAGAALKSIEQTLAWCPSASPESLQATLDLVSKECIPVSIRPAMRGERGYCYRVSELFERGEIKSDDPLAPPRPSFSDRAVTLYYHQFLPNNAALILDKFAELLAMCELPPAQKLAAGLAWDMPPRNRETMIARIVMPTVKKVMEAEVRHLAKCLCTAAGIACELYRLKHNKWPEHLDDLAEFGLEKVLIDPFDGQPLRYRIVEDGAVVYSVGTNGIDDEGDVVRREGSPNDVGFRLWNPNKRRVSLHEGPKIMDELP